MAFACGEKRQTMNIYTSAETPFHPFGHALDTFSTRFRLFLAFFDKSSRRRYFFSFFRFWPQNLVQFALKTVGVVFIPPKQNLHLWQNF
jgi:hypothetical protein